MFKPLFERPRFYSFSNMKDNIVELFWYYPKSVLVRGLFGVSNRDAWDLHSYISLVIKRGIENIEKSRMGHPCFGVNPPDECKSCKCNERWSQILKDIKDGLDSGEEYLEDLDSQIRELNTKTVDPRKIKFDKAMDLLKEYYFNLWD